MNYNERLKNMVTLRSKVTVYVPATTGINVEIDNTKYVESTATLLSNCFGGATSTPALGFWVSDTMGLVREKTTIVFAFADDDALDAHIADIIEHCIGIKTELGQDAVALEVNGQMYFI